jgi:hypothetical protein
MRSWQKDTGTGDYKMALTVNADDFGKNESINKAICEAFEKGYISTTTLMANMPAVEDAYRLAEEKGFIDRVGIHLNITEGMPLTKGIRNNPLICASDGSFNAAFYHNTKYRLYMDRQSIDRIRDEFDAQISRFLELGFKTLHIDSHHHVHTNYPVYCALKELSGKYDFEYIRLSRNLYRGGSLFNNVYKLIYNRSVRKLCAQTSDRFGSYKDLKNYTSNNSLNDKELVEIMVHPMYDEGGRLVDTDIPMNEEGFDIMGL